MSIGERLCWLINKTKSTHVVDKHTRPVHSRSLTVRNEGWLARAALAVPRLCTKSASPVSEPGAVATGPILNAWPRATILRLNLWPVATAPGSDTARRSFMTFCAKPTEGVRCNSQGQRPLEVFRGKDSFLRAPRSKRARGPRSE